ncbi:hypothetical protein HDU96_006337 [Phlyctochytrium bullatum]|nr:hypothetical protein HDU96_006337 [Phlyctochytrium bullatum]
MPFCEVGKDREIEPVKLYYETHGSGPQKIMFIMGLTADHTRWDFQKDFFKELDEYEVCVFDNRGIGFSTAPPGRYTTRMMALDAWELLQHLKWKRAHVVGLSMGDTLCLMAIHVRSTIKCYSIGGMIAQELALHVPDAILSLALVSTTPGRSIPPIKTLWAMKGTVGVLPPEQDFKLMTRIIYPRWWLDANAPPGSGCITNTDYMRKWWEDRQDRVPRPHENGVKGQRMACYTHYVSRARLRKLRDFGIPIIVLTGDDDILVRPSNSIYLARNLRARLEIFIGGGHGLERFNKVLLKHFRRSLELRPLPLDEDEVLHMVQSRPPGKPNDFVPSMDGVKVVPSRLRVKKVAKWACKVCGEKQSVVREYFEGSAPECRKVVQKMNLKRGTLELEKDDILYDLAESKFDVMDGRGGDEGFQNAMESLAKGKPRILGRSDSKWADFDEGEDSDDGMVEKPKLPQGRASRGGYGQGRKNGSARGGGVKRGRGGYRQQNMMHDGEPEGEDDDGPVKGWKRARQKDDGFMPPPAPPAHRFPENGNARGYQQFGHDAEIPRGDGPQPTPSAHGFPDRLANNAAPGFHRNMVEESPVDYSQNWNRPRPQGPGTHANSITGLRAGAGTYERTKGATAKPKGMPFSEIKGHFSNASFDRRPAAAPSRMVGEPGTEAIETNETPFSDIVDFFAGSQASQGRRAAGGTGGYSGHAATGYDNVNRPIGAGMVRRNDPTTAYTNQGHHAAGSFAPTPSIMISNVRPAVPKSVSHAERPPTAYTNNARPTTASAPNPRLGATGYANFNRPLGAGMVSRNDPTTAYTNHGRPAAGSFAPTPSISNPRPTVPRSVNHAERPPTAYTNSRPTIASAFNACGPVGGPTHRDDRPAPATLFAGIPSRAKNPIADPRAHPGGTGNPAPRSHPHAAPAAGPKRPSMWDSFVDPEEADDSD